MLKILLTIIGISSVIAIPTQSLYLSLNAENFFLRELLENKKLMFRYILTMFIITPLLVIVFYNIVGPYNGLWIAMFIISLTPASPAVIKNINKLGVSKNISISWMILTIFLSLIFVPFNLILVENYFNLDIDLGIKEVFLKLMLMFVLPMVAGFLISKYFKKYVPVLKKIVGPISSISSLVLVVSLFIIGIKLIINNGLIPLLLILAFLILTLIISHIMGSPEKQYGPVLAYSVILRLPAPAIILSQLNNTVEKHLPVILTYTILSALVMIVYNKLFLSKKKSE